MNRELYDTRQGTIPDEPIGRQVKLSSFDVNNLAVRVHELALQKWLNSNFFVADGYPIPVLFSNPADAFGEFSRLWEQGVYAYLYDAVDSFGEKIQPYPSPAKYPIISVKRNTWRFSPTRNFSTRFFRRVAYPTVHSDVTKNDLGNVYINRMPAAWDFSFQIDFQSTHMFTHSYIVDRIMRSLFHSAGEAQTWILVKYPGFFGKHLVRAVIGDITDLTEEDPNSEQQTIFRCSIPITLEGWSPELNPILVPTLWKEAITKTTYVLKDTLDKIYSEDREITDLRPTEEHPEIINQAFNALPNMPPATF